MIEITSLYKKFSDNWVVEDLNLSIKPGEFYCLLGPNGAGKTTTLKLLTGLLKPSRGAITLGGIDLHQDPVRAKQQLGYIPDTPFLYENLTALEFLQFIGTIFNVSSQQVMREAEEYLTGFGLWEQRFTLLKDFSHGMRQKIIYIANFIHHPRIFLIDEPLVGLDPQGIHLIKQLLQKKLSQGMTIMMCTHILHIAEELAHRIGILKRGRIIAEGTMTQLRQSVQDGSLEDIFLTITGDNA